MFKNSRFLRFYYSSQETDSRGRSRAQGLYQFKMNQRTETDSHTYLTIHVRDTCNIISILHQSSRSQRTNSVTVKPSLSQAEEKLKDCIIVSLYLTMAPSDRKRLLACAFVLALMATVIPTMRTSSSHQLPWSASSIGKSSMKGIMFLFTYEI